MAAGTAAGTTARRFGEARDAVRALPWGRARARTLRVNEIFHSIQGEGSRAGTPMVFVRLTGCALRCVWCDSAYAFYEGERLSLADVRGRVLAARSAAVEFTGGEPLLQPALWPLMRKLARGDGLEVLVETGGDQDVAPLPAEVVAIVDVKCPGSGMAERTDLSNLARLRPRDEVKFVIAGRADYDYARRIVAEHGLDASGRTILLSPVHGVLDPADLAGWMLADGLGARLQVQLHKVIWPGEARGR